MRGNYKWNCDDNNSTDRRFVFILCCVVVVLLLLHFVLSFVFPLFWMLLCLFCEFMIWSFSFFTPTIFRGAVALFCVNAKVPLYGHAWDVQESIHRRCSIPEWDGINGKSIFRFAQIKIGTYLRSDSIERPRYTVVVSMILSTIPHLPWSIASKRNPIYFWKS